MDGAAAQTVSCLRSTAGFRAAGTAVKFSESSRWRLFFSWLAGSQGRSVVAVGEVASWSRASSPFVPCLFREQQHFFFNWE